MNKEQILDDIAALIEGSINKSKAIAALRQELKDCNQDRAEMEKEINRLEGVIQEMTVEVLEAR